MSAIKSASLHRFQSLSVQNNSDNARATDCRRSSRNPPDIALELALVSHDKLIEIVSTEISRMNEKKSHHSSTLDTWRAMETWEVCHRLNRWVTV